MICDWLLDDWDPDDWAVCQSGVLLILSARSQVPDALFGVESGTAPDVLLTASDN